MTNAQTPEGSIEEAQEPPFDLFRAIEDEVGAPTRTRQPHGSISVSFSNTGARSDGWFQLTTEQILSVLHDLQINQAAIVAITGDPAAYHERTWREIFEDVLTDDVAKSMGKVQTMPLFELLSKIVHFSNTTDERTPKQLDLSIAALIRAQEEIEAWVAANFGNGTVPPIATAIPGGRNVIFYGAPGTGKSRKVNDEIEKEIHFRTVFHADLENSDFFGSLKPQMAGKKVRYGFSAGPFMKAMAAAHSNPDKPVYLVIEELNRASAAAVFGDLFLLLDRHDNGEGEYAAHFPTDESAEWLQEQSGSSISELRLPSNLTIYATMNSADQGVYPIDTAFRRRWEQEYLPIDYTCGTVGNLGYTDETGTKHTINWRDFVQVLNEYLLGLDTLEIPEDRLLGQWFVKTNDLTAGGIPRKVLIYLWDDLLRHGGRELVFDTDKIKTYGSLDTISASGGRFFAKSFLEALNASSTGAAVASAAQSQTADSQDTDVGELNETKAENADSALENGPDEGSAPAVQSEFEDSGDDE